MFSDTIPRYRDSIAKKKTTPLSETRLLFSRFGFEGGRGKCLKDGLKNII